MNVIEKLPTTLGRRDEVPNQELAAEIVAADIGSVIRRDHCVKILISLSAVEKYSDKAFPLLLEQLMTCPTNQLPMYIENAQHIIDTTTKNAFVKVLSQRIDEIEKESKRKRIEKAIKRVEKL